MGCIVLEVCWKEDAALSVAREGGGSAAADEPAQVARRRTGKPRVVRALEMSKTCHTDHIGLVPRAGSRTIGMAKLSAGGVVSIARHERELDLEAFSSDLIDKNTELGRKVGELQAQILILEAEVATSCMVSIARNEFSGS